MVALWHVGRASALRFTKRPKEPKEWLRNVEHDSVRGPQIILSLMQMETADSVDSADIVVSMAELGV